MTKTRALVLIPARMAATRLPGKPLLDIGELPMIVQVVRRAEAARSEGSWWRRIQRISRQPSPAMAVRPS
jgi:hypothetical protein